MYLVQIIMMLSTVLAELTEGGRCPAGMQINSTELQCCNGLLRYRHAGSCIVRIISLKNLLWRCHQNVIRTVAIKTMRLQCNNI